MSKGVRSPTRRNLKKADRREQILRAALKAFTKGGYHGTHVEHVVKEAGIARGTFYMHFESKHDVFDALVERTFDVFLDVRPAGEAIDVRSIRDAERMLRDSYTVVLTTFHKHRRLTRLLFDEAVGLEKGFRKKLEGHYRVWHERVSETLDMLVERGVARRTLDVEITSEMVIGMVERIARRYLFQSRRPDIERLADALVSFELGGIELA